MRPFADPNDRYSYEDWMNDMGQGYYSVIATPREALYEAACATLRIR